MNDFEIVKQLMEKEIKELPNDSPFKKLKFNKSTGNYSLPKEVEDKTIQGEINNGRFKFHNY